MTETRWAAAVDAMLAILRADPVVSLATISDGPRVVDDGIFVVIGHDDSPDDDMAGMISQEWHDAGISARRDDECSIRCAVAAQSGSSDMAEVRTACFSLFAAVGSALRADPSLGMVQVISAEATSSTVRQGRTDRGVYCLIQFTVDVVSVI